MEKEIIDICKKYQEEYTNGHWYITQIGLIKVAKVLGGQYVDLTPKQRKIFRQDCVDTAQDGFSNVKMWWDYINY